MKIFGGLKLYPNGFLGAPIEYRKAQVGQPIQVDLIGTAMRRISLEPEDTDMAPNQEIEEIWKETTKHEDILKRDHAFRERLYVAGLRAFGTLTINDWIEKQKQNPYFDTMQNRFVDETVCYVYTGFRKYHPSIYLDTCTIGKHNAWTIGVATREYLVNYRNEPVLIRDFLRTWLGQRDGISDMLFTLRVFFGS
uniref:Virion structural protein n=1 Tax=Burkholderia phage vB_BgluM-SURPRISE13 TaxID=3159457 RepID=A0AAU7PFK4_9VIRU